MADKRHHIHGATLIADALVILAQPLPVPGQVGVKKTNVFFQQVERFGSHRRGREAAVANHLGRNALTHLAVRPRRTQQGEVGMGMRINESRRHDAAAGVDIYRRVSLQPSRQGGNPTAADTDVCSYSRPPSAIDHRSTLYQQIKRHNGHLVTGRLRAPSDVRLADGAIIGQTLAVTYRKLSHPSA